MSRWPNKYIIGLTGNIATGKSVVRQMLQHSGAYTIDADSLTHRVMMPGAPAYKPIVETFGQMIVGDDGKINRQMLSSIVFSNAAALKKLEQITHPIIRQAIHALINRSKQRVIVIEAIKLLEGDLAQEVDAVWVVNAKPQTQYKRLLQKRKMSPEDAKRRMLAQSAQSEKVKQAHVVIDNNGDIEQTWKQVRTQWNEIRKQLSQPSPGSRTAPAQAAARPAARPQPTASVAASSGSTAAPAGASDVTVRRGMPDNAGQIAAFLTARTGKEVSRMDVMMTFGQKSYHIAENKDADLQGVMGWTVENLVTRIDETHLAPGAPVASLVSALVTAIEAGSAELQSEVSFIFLSEETPTDLLRAFQANGYEQTTLPEIKIPVWREAVEEALSVAKRHVLWKQLRQDRVLQPI